MTTPTADPNDQNKREEILGRRNAEGGRLYDHVYHDPATGEWTARHRDDHTKRDRV